MNGCPLFCSSILFQMFPLCSSLRGTHFLSKNGDRTPYIYVYESVFPLFLYYYSTIGVFFILPYEVSSSPKKFPITLIFLGERGEQGNNRIMTPFRGEQTGEQNSSKWNKQGNKPVHDEGTRYFFVVDARGTVE